MDGVVNKFTEINPIYGTFNGNQYIFFQLINNFTKILYLSYQWEPVIQLKNNISKVLSVEQNHPEIRQSLILPRISIKYYKTLRQFEKIESLFSQSQEDNQKSSQLLNNDEL
ncbi:hypothetical protein pb186bvf_003884 [Paramecium bursaria]